MAVFDPVKRQIVMRVVYDGVGQAGKTTNLQQLLHTFTSVRRGELHARETARGRTLFFDWLQLEGGLIDGHSYRAELLTVPGQSVLRQRRLYLLRRADAVVLVVDSSLNGVREGIVALEALHECRALDPPPLIVQANKQDLEGALAPEEVRKQLGLGDNVCVVGAVASRGIGIRDTALLALREAAKFLEPSILRAGTEALAETLDTPDALYVDMKALPVEVRYDAVAARRARTSSPAEAGLISHAPLPTPALPSHYIWPAATGRALLRSLLLEVPTDTPELSHGAGVEQSVVYRVGEYCLRTRLSQRFSDEDSAQQALLANARLKVALGALLPRDSALVLQPDQGGGLWLWTLARWTPSLQQTMEQAAERGDARDLGEQLERYAQACFDALSLLDRGLCLDVSPSNLAYDIDHCVYIDDRIALVRVMPNLGAAWLERVDTYHTWPAAIERYLAALQRGLVERERSRPMAQIDWAATLEQAPVKTDAAHVARSHLLAAARRARPA